MLPLYDENRPLRRPYVNYTLIAANIFLFFLFYLQGPKVYEWIVMNYGLIPLYVLKGQRLHTFITSMFLHGDILHLAGNMLFLFIFGDNVEDAFGHIGYLIFYFVAGVGASLIHILSLFAMPTDLFIYSIKIPSIGASGAISGVLGAYFILYPKARIKTLVMTTVMTIVTVPAIYFIGFWFFYQLVMGVFSLALPVSVAFWAHVGGFIVGVLVVKLLRIKPPLKRKAVYYYRITVREPYP